MALGTHAYMRPEQAARQTKDLDGRADVYGLGCVLFELPTGRTPHEGVDYRVLLSQILLGDTPRGAAASAGSPSIRTRRCGSR